MFLRKASSSVFGVARFDASGAAISADARYQKITGADAKALETDTGMRTWRGALTAKGGKLADAPVWKALAKGEPQYVEYRVTKDGAAVWVGATLAPETDGRGGLRAIVEHAVDITAHKAALGDRDDAFEALERSMAIVEFDLDGVILKANDVFLSAVGRDAKDVVGRKHGAFVAPEDRDGDAYGDMMAKLRQGERQAGVFRRRDADGREFWLQATYSPILDAAGAPVRVLELATDVTDASASAVEAAGRDNAMNRSQAVIEFELDGTIIKANKNFLDTVGYSLEEIVGQKHSMFVAPEDRAGAEYKALWDGLRQGEFQAGEFRRVGKDDREIWLQASYNPIFNAAGKPIRVVKFALDATAQKQAAIEAAGKLQAISRSQAVIEFELDGTVIAANDNFLAALGYEASEVVGRHHRIFVPTEEAESAAYKAFWESLGRGEFQSGEYERRAKDGSEIWIQATYNPILDAAGKPYKVVKFASDVTAQKREREAAEAERRETAAAQSAVVGALSASLGRMAEGDLTAAITTRFAEEYEGLRSNFNKAQEELRRIIENVVAKAASFDSGAGEVNRATDDLARRTESQAAALEETFAALNQINEGLSTTAASADKAAKVTSASVDSARNGEGVVQRSLNAMTEIEKSSKNVVGIVAVIEDIAFQTNLLALNAGVEAARAGESGRGFAVVASEVRSLSQRCAEAAKEIKDLIMATDAQIVTGVELVRETGESLAGIAKHIGEISELVSGISRESAEQSTGVGEIIVAMRQLDEVTQQNAAMGEEMSAASADLQSESSEMATLVARFRTGSEASAQPAARKPVRARAGGAAAPKPAAAAPAAKPAAAPAPARPKRAAASGAAAAAAVAEDEDGWEEF